MIDLRIGSVGDRVLLTKDMSFQFTLDESGVFFLDTVPKNPLWYCFVMLHRGNCEITMRRTLKGVQFLSWRKRQ